MLGLLWKLKYLLKKCFTHIIHQNALKAMIYTFKVAKYEYNMNLYLELPKPLKEFDKTELNEWFERIDAVFEKVKGI